MASFTALVSQVLGSLDVEETAGLLWFGRPIIQDLWHPTKSMHPDQHRALVFTGLRNHLYRHFYCWGEAVPYAADWDTSPARDPWQFRRRLSNANVVSEIWDAGWRVQRRSSSGVVLNRHRMTVLVEPGDCRENGEVPVGGFVDIRHPKESFHRSPGFYLAYGRAPLDEGNVGGGLVRIYWNVDPEGAVLLVKAVTTWLDGARLPFHLKVLADPIAYGRCDAAVLYLRKADYAELGSCAEAILAALPNHLGDATPAFTKRVAAGVGVAEDPGDLWSFGHHRCGLLAEAILKPEGEAWILERSARAVADYFERHQVDPLRPYLNASSADAYDVFPAAARRWVATGRAPLATPAVTYSAALDVARRLGNRLARTAYWHRGQCNWLGAPSAISLGTPEGSFASLGSDLYDGTSGLAFFLGELFAATGDEEFRRTALGAIAHALANPETRSGRRRGFYLGSLGTSVVAARLGHVLGSPDLTEMALDVARVAQTRDPGFDVMSGQAGSVLGFLALHELIGDSALLEQATRNADLLLAAAEGSPEGLSWAAEQGELASGPTRNLTGFSHGTAGVSYALLALFDATGDEEYMRVAKEAMRYEQECFNRREGNWPDFRQVPRSAALESVRVPCATTWCHGAPGIAISRIHAARVLPDASYDAEARLALETTREHLRGWLVSSHPNFSLCHGVAGNADILLMSVRSAPSLGFDADGMVEQTARLGLASYGPDGDWPCGVGRGGFSPGLMVGLAGIGYFYLRLAREQVPSVIAPLSGPGWGPPDATPHPRQRCIHRPHDQRFQNRDG
jgi:hypothetical protein